MDAHQMATHQRKRQVRELNHWEAWLTEGRGSFHVENLEWVFRMLRYGLQATGLLSRGEQNARSPILKKLRFSFAALPEELCGLRILHLSDLHADGLAGLVEGICARLQGLRVDICVLTGDYRFAVRGPCHSMYANMEKILDAVDARYGTVGILGNHDFWEEVPELERMGVTMLVNNAHEIRHNRASLWLVGVDDPHYYGCDDLPAALQTVPADGFKILLVHSPEMIPDAAAQGIHLYLCGHTHGGQIRLPGIGPILLNSNCPRKYTYGRWQYDSVQGYTSAGVGSSGLPVRFLCPPEIGLIELRCAHIHTPETYHVKEKNYE